MKKLLFLAALAISAFSMKPSISQAQVPSFVYTPRSTQVPAWLFNTEPYTPAQLAAFTAQVAAQYPLATIIAPATGRYNCHSYGWHSSSTENNKWLDSPSDDKYWTDGSYTYTANANNAIKWSYVNGDHSARTYPLGQATTFRSKWGAWPLMFHKWNYTPYNSSSMWGFETCTASPNTCAAPGFINYTNLTANSVTIYWTRACNASQYQVQYRLNGGSSWIGLTIFAASTAPHFTVSRNITGLSPNTCYNFRVKVINGSGVAYSSSITVCSSAQRPSEGEINPFVSEMNDYSEEAMPTIGVSEREKSTLETSHSGNIFPNPATGHANLIYNLERGGKVKIQLFDNFNRLVMENLVESDGAGEQSTEIDLSNLQNGLYFARVSSGKQLETYKIEVLR